MFKRCIVPHNTDYTNLENDETNEHRPFIMKSKTLKQGREVSYERISSKLQEHENLQLVCNNPSPVINS